MRSWLLLFSFFLTLTLQAQEYSGRVTDAATSEGLAFATIRIDNGKEGLVTDLNGYFRISTGREVRSIEVSYLGYETQRIPVAAGIDIQIRLHPSERSLNEFVFKPPYEKIRRILDAAIANRDRHNPEQYDWYRCHVYYKMVADLRLPDSSMEKLKADTAAESQSEYRFLSSQHLLMSETYSIRTWKRPQRLQEDVIASRLSGFKKSLFTNLITDVLPFHAYTDYITLNLKDYHNPVSKGYAGRYDFNLNDELIQGSDTLWILSFRPRKGTITGLKGTVYINSNGYAIAYLLAQAKDEDLKRTVRLEQQYQQTGGRWFPRELNYILQFERKETKYKLEGDEEMHYAIQLKGNSQIDSVSFAPDERFKFDKAHTVRLQEGADEKAESAWSDIRPAALSEREARTYSFNDSIIHAMKFDRIVPYLEKLVEGKIPVGPLDLDLKRLYSFNKYEGSRLGAGLQTNERISKRFTLGGWFGYGMRDKEWKYGGFAEYYGDRYREFTISAGYSKDLRDPGRIQLHPELEKAYLRTFLMYRVDEVTAWWGSVRKKLGYLDLELSGRQEEIRPRYDYAFNAGGELSSRFTAREASLRLRYVYAERRAPLFGKYYNTGSKYPMLYGKLTAGIIETGATERPYLQTLAAVRWSRHINRLGNEHFYLLAGKTWSNDALPLSRMFAGNGLRYDQGALYFFGGMLTMYPYEYYCDQFINFYWKHDFDRRLYQTGISAPFVSLAHNILAGTMQHQDAHLLVDFSVPGGSGYHESGLLLNHLLRVNYLNVYYFTLNGGYFYHWDDPADLERNGRFVFGLGVDF